MDPDVPIVDVDTGQQQKQESCYLGGGCGNNPSENQDHRFHSRHHNPLPPHSPASSLSSCSPSSYVVGEVSSRGSGGCISNLHCQSVRHPSFDNFSKKGKDGSNRMTPEEGQDALVVVDHQQYHRHHHHQQQRVPPERPSSSSRVPCPKFSSNSQKCDSCGLEFDTTNLYLEHVCESSKKYNITMDVGNSDGSRPTSTLVVPTSQPHLSGGFGALGRSPSSAAFCSSSGNELSNSSASDVENFTGKIVYNPDGSAFILETGDSEELSDEDDDEHHHLGGASSRSHHHIVGRSSQQQRHQQQQFGVMVNALHIARNPALYNALYGQAAYSFLQEKNKVPDVPVMHSFRVFTVRDKSGDPVPSKSESSEKRPPIDRANFPMVDYSSVPIKPILMCFLCKLSFGYAKSFVAHAMGEHTITLNEEEKSIMSEKNTSAIIQGVGKDKEPLLSFLEPIPSSTTTLDISSGGSSSGGVQQQHRGIPSSGGGFFNQPMHQQSSCSSSFGPSDPVTSLLNAVSSAMAGGCYGSSAITTLVSAISSPVAALSEIKPPPASSAPMSTSTGGGISSLLASSDNEEALAPELQDLATIEKMAKAAAAAAEADITPTLSPIGSINGGNSASNVNKESHNKCFNGQGDHHHPGQEHRLSVFEYSQHPNLTTAVSTSMSLSSLERPTSAGSHDSSSPGVRVSPKNVPVPSPSLTTVPSPSPTTSSPVMVCPQHPDGRSSGVECPKCDLILGSSRSLGGHMTMMHSRNSCKTLKCPKCNWHYKYQETLEIHMKEKHPENDLSCIYCLTNQTHPRLARGETYTCGYKPYRCEVCNYSTTTKGNLSIHMQSDKHINNVQELQNGNIPSDHVMTQQSMPAPQPLATPPMSDTTSKKPIPTTKPKATWRCDVCNYETNVARNLRIHMTSEKHNHNMMVLQQNVKHMQQLSAFQQAQAAQAQAIDPMFQFHPGLLMPCDSQLQPEAALADMAYNHALLMMATQQQQQRAMAAAAAAAAAASGKSSISTSLNMNVPPTLDIEHPDPSLRPDVPYDESSKLFQCCVCHVHSSDSVDALNQHAQLDRTRQREEEVLMVVAGTYICKLCTYKTNLKANFQLHCKTDKHLQRLQHVNHVKEGGTSTEWKLKYANVSNPVQVRCNACDYYTNSIHKLQMHTANPRHEANSRIFTHLQIGQNALKAEAHFFHCKLCNFSTKAKYKLIQHVNSIRHLRHENLRQMQLRNEGRLVEEDLRDYVLVKELKGNENIIFDADVDTPIIEFPDEDNIRTDSKSEPTSEERSPPDSRLKMALLEQSKLTNCETSVSTEQHQCPFCNYSSNSEVRIQMHVVAQHTTQPDIVSCPLCQEGCKDLSVLENHLMEIHNVTKEGVQRLLLMVDVPSSTSKKDNEQVKTQGIENNPAKQQSPEPERITSPENKANEENGDDLACSVCGKIFVCIDDLFSHQNEAGHMELKPTPLGLGYQCWKKGCTQYFKTMLSLQMHFKEIHVKKILLAVSDRHVYKYRCNQCSLAFKTLEKLQLHSQYHMIRAATKCVLCGRCFRSVIALQKHVETTHTDMTKEQLEQYKASLANNPLLVGGGCGVLDPQTTELLKKESIRDELECVEEVVDAGTEKDDGLSPLRDVDCDHIEEPPVTDGLNTNQDVLEDYINSQSVAEDSYNDANRKYKCHRCKVAFTRQSYLTSHNKTLLHRKGEKMSYPMEKYLDPNRPFKCEICMESFTQKNILLVHYNSVSHLHKVKLSMKENNNTTTTSPTSFTISVTPASSASNVSNLLNTQNQETEKKPYKCNICKVSYSQGSTLDIHVRSVLHQTRASKLHELAMTGQLDLSVPLIERPEQSLTENQPQQQLLLAPPNSTSESSFLTLPQSSSGTATSVPSVQAPKIPDLPKVPSSSSSCGATPTTITTTTTTTITSASPQLQLPTDVASMTKVLGLTPPVVPQSPVLSTSTSTTASTVVCARCNTSCTSQEMLIQHQSLCYLFNQPLPLGKNTMNSSNGANNCGSGSTHLQQPPPPPPPTPLPEMTANKMESNKIPTKEDDSVFSNFHQSKTTLPPDSNQSQDNPVTSSINQLPIRPRCPFPRPRPLVYKHLIESFGFDVVMQFNENNQKRRKLEKRDHELITVKTENQKVGGDVGEYSEIVKTEIVEEQDEVKNTDITDLPEINRSVCNVCSKEFTSIWVLKSHKEEIHKEIVPFEFLESFAECYRSEYEKRNVVDQIHSVTDESNIESGTPVPPIKSEPALCPTPSSASSSSSAQHSMSATPPTSSIPSQTSDVSSSAAANQMAAQLQFNQLLMSMGLGMSLPMGMNLNMPFAAAAAMNMHPPLIPVLLPPPMDPLMASAFNHPVMPGGVDANFFAAQQKMLQHQQALANAQSQQKRARTRISDEQLKILRTYFDINNSPTEEQLIEMSEKSGLPLKVIKHWFRNTLFKERQRNKDSPYNFNNPPSTFLNLEEYEKTGEAKVIPINRNDFLSSKADADSTNHSEDGRCSIVEDTDSSQEDKDKPDIEYHHHHHHHHEPDRKSSSSAKHEALCSQTPTSVGGGVFPNFHGMDIPMPMSGNVDVCKDLQLFSSQPPSPSSQPSPSINFSSVTSITTPLVPAASSSPPTSDSPRAFSSPSFCGNPSLNVSSGSGKRANRTRFTDYQIKVLQEFFESNAYPKDDDLEYLSKLLNLSPRVIVVWFQNARQKARKVYENQPPINADEDSAGKFQRTPGLNYQCKKCLQVFQRYYELIKHQKSSCFKDENPIAVQMKAAAAIMDEKSQGSSVSEPSSIVARTPDKFGQNGTYRCDKCSLAFPRFDLWREHQIVHIMNPNLFPNYSPNSSFGILQYEAQQPPTPPLKRKLSEDEEIKDIGGEQPKDKRLRTTILPEQLDYLYQKYQIESNPSRKMLENIAREVGLKKRVVQVWFQNTRARERKGQFRAHQQVIHKRCPFCRALFKARSALESHLATRHADQYTRGDINIDSLPDGDIDSNPGTPSTSNASEDVRNSLFPPFSSVSTTASISNPIFPSHASDPVQSSMKKYYEDSLKKYLDELTATATTSVSKESTAPSDLSIKAVKSPVGEKVTGQSGGDTPLDLSKPVKICIETEKSHDCLPTNLSDKSVEESMNRSIVSTEDARSETHSESTDNMDIEDASHESNPTSPSNSAHRSSSAGGKRFRTQMSTVQLKIMKSIFSDYKTPSMAECESLGREIGLPKRVVQVWFQNARAKEKKAKLAFLKTFGHEMEGPKLPEECLVCKVKYNVKFSNTSMQDHLFSKRHLDNMKAHITNMKKMADGQDSLIDGHDQSSSTPSNLLNQLSQQQQPNLSISEDQDRAGPLIPATNTPSLMQQLQMMGQLQQMSGLNLPGFPSNIMPGSNGSGNPTTSAVRSPPSSTSSISPNHMTPCKDDKLSPSVDKVSNNAIGGNKNNIVENDVTNQPQASPTPNTTNPVNRKDDKKDQQDVVNGGNPATASIPSPHQRQGNVTDFPIPTSDAAGLFPYMYAGFPGYYAGLPGAFFHPGVYPASPQGGLFYDSNLYSTPLSLLQLPPTALPEVTQKLTQPGNTTARFSQDGKTLEDLKGVVSTTDYQQAAEAEVDVGYVCKKCQLVHPAEVLCLNHQRTSCFSNNNNKTGPNDVKAVLRLVQVQLECRACRERFPTILDFKFHCNADRHIKRVQKLQKSEVNQSLIVTPSTTTSQRMLPPMASQAGMFSASHFAATPVAPTSMAPRMAPPPLLLPQTPQSIATGNDVTRNGPDVTARHLLFSSGMPHDFRSDLDGTLSLGLEASPLDLPATSKSGICFTGEASLSPETKRL